MAQRAEQKVLSATRAQAVAATTATVFSEPTVAVFCNDAGNLVGTLAGDSTDSTFAVVAGMMYPLSFINIDVTNAVAIVALFNTQA